MHVGIAFNEDSFKGKAVGAGRQGAHCLAGSVGRLWGSMGQLWGSRKPGHVSRCPSAFTYLSRLLMVQPLPLP